MTNQALMNSKVLIEGVDDISSYDHVKASVSSLLDKIKNDVHIPDGARIVIKLNLCLLKGPETGATVDPRVARALAEWLFDHYDISRIYLAEADATHLGAEMAFRILGWHEMFADMPRVSLLNLSEDETVPVAGRVIKDLRMAKTMMEADLLVSLAKLKTHTQQKITCIMKNQFGAIPFKYKVTYHPILAEAIYEATAARPPDLCFVDGLVAMEGNGPTNGTPRRTKLLIASNDAVSIDHFCARLMGFRPSTIPHLKLAYTRGLGSRDYSVHGSLPDPLNLRFKFLPKWKELAKKTIALVQRGVDK
jgi:uncharacterized protein (DUF362 family)